LKCYLPNLLFIYKMENYLPLAILNVTQENDYGQFVDIEQTIKYVSPENDLTVMYTIASLSVFQIFAVYLLFQYIHA
jgi:hypothetical protein